MGADPTGLEAGELGGEIIGGGPWVFLCCVQGRLLCEGPPGGGTPGCV